MKKAAKGWLIAATVLTIAGLLTITGALAAVGFDVTKLNTVKYVSEEKSISESFDSIAINVETAGIELAPSEDKECSVVFHRREKEQYDVVVKDKTLTICGDKNRKWYEYIGFDFDSPRITVSLPKSQYDAITVNAVTGSLNLRDLQLNSLSVKTTTGNIRLDALNVGGDIDLATSTGNILLANTVAKNDMRLECSTGNIHFESADSAQIIARTTTGNIKGTLLSGKTFRTKTSTGSVNVPQDSAGGNCELSTSTGNIKIAIQQ